MKKVLITGATGFIGRNSLMPLLEKGYEVHATFTRQVIPDGLMEANWHRIDLMEPGALSTLLEAIRPTHLLHFAWNTKPTEYWTSPQNLRWVSTSLHLLHEFARYGGKRVVMVGSCAEYDWDHGYCSENKTPLRPATLYGICKGALRSMLEAYSEQAAIRCAWGRVFFLYGPNEHPNRLVSSVIRHLLAGEQAHCSSGTQIRDFLHVRDAADAFAALLDSDLQGAVNIASGKPVALHEIVRKVGDKIGRNDLIALGARPDRTNDPPVLFANVHRLSEELHWSPKYDLDSGLEHTIHWWKTVMRRER